MRFDAEQLAGVPFNPRSAVAVLAHLLFLAKHGAPSTRFLGPGIVRAWEVAVFVWGPR